jgi:hypothetical protein
MMFCADNFFFEWFFTVLATHLSFWFFEECD